MATHAGPGHVQWIGIRPARKAPMQELSEVRVALDGLQGDRHSAANKRAVTLLQGEYLPVIAALARRDRVHPAMLRRNLVIHGINLSALRRTELMIGTVTLEITGPCAPCSRMEDTLGPGGYSAMRNHGGMTARVLVPGLIRLQDPVGPVAKT